MRKWILFMTFFASLAFSLRAQDEVGCQQLFEDAKEAYNAGMVELVPELLLDCLGSGLNGETKKEAYKLVIKAYLFDYLPDEAGLLMESMLSDFPDFQPADSDEADFVQLFNLKKEARAQQVVQEEKSPEVEPEVEEQKEPVDPDELERRRLERIRQEQIRQQQQARDQQEKTGRKASKPERTGTDLSRYVGVSTGFGFGLPWLLEAYSLGDPNDVESAFGLSIPGLRLGAVYARPLTPALELQTGLGFLQSRFTYHSAPFEYAEYTLSERQLSLRAPVAVAWHLNPGAKNQVYVRAGAALNYLLSAKADGVRSYVEGTSGDVSLDAQSITEARTRMNVFAEAGVGWKIPFEKTLFFVEADYAFGLLQANNPDARYQTGDLLWVLYHVDPDFRLDQVILKAGFAWNL